MFKGEEPEANMKSTQYPRVTKNKSSSYKNKDIRYKNIKKKKRKKGRSRLQIPSESDDEYSSKEDNDESVSGLPGLQERNQFDSESKNDEKNNNNHNDKRYDGADSYAITNLSKFSSEPSAFHYKLLRGVAKYLRSTITWGIWFNCPTPLDLGILQDSVPYLDPENPRMNS